MSTETIVGVDRTYAQAVVSDGTLNTIVTPSGNTFTIDNGTTSGTNLFHSFREFSIPTGGTAIFNNATTIQNIFSRVTGGTVSNIDGAIQANGTANLFLLNPAGILFGSNASLNIGGSFVGTTANSIKFADGVEFSGVNATSPPLLTMSAPIGLQMGITPANIQVKGTGHTLTSPSASSPLQGTVSGDLQVQPSKTLALIGGDVTLNGAILSAENGRVEIGSFIHGDITLKPTAFGWTLDYSPLQNSPEHYGNIQMSSASLVNANGSDSKGIQLTGRKIAITGGSLGWVKTSGNSPDARIALYAAESLEIIGTTPQRGTAISSGLRTQTIMSGNGGNITIVAPHFQATDGGRIEASAFDTSTGGNVTVKASESVEFNSVSPLSTLLRSGIDVKNFGLGISGNLTVSTTRLKILGGAYLGSGTSSAGQGGSLIIKATDSIEVIGFNRVTPSSSPTRSVITSASQSSGSSGNLSIDTARLILRNGGRVNAGTLASGSGKDLMINASEFIEVSGFVDGNPNLPSTLVAGAEANNPVQRLLGLPLIPSGNSGNAIINTPKMMVLNLAQVGVENQGFGNAGTLRITADSILVDQGGRITASTQFGTGGNTDLNVRDFILLRHGSSISARGGGAGTGGNITINSPIIVGLENSDIIANAVNGNGGNIKITTQGILGLEFRNTKTPRTDLTNDITASSEVGLNGTVEINHIGVEPSSGLVELPTNLSDATRQIAKGCQGTQGSRFIVTGRGGMPQNPTQVVSSDRTWNDVRDLSGFHKGAIAQAPSSLPSIVQANTWYRNPQTGKVELLATQPSHPTPSATCANASHPTGSNL